MVLQQNKCGQTRVLPHQIHQYEWSDHESFESFDNLSNNTIHISAFDQWQKLPNRGHYKSTIGMLTWKSLLFARKICPAPINIGWNFCLGFPHLCQTDGYQ